VEYNGLDEVAPGDLEAVLQELDAAFPATAAAPVQNTPEPVGTANSSGRTCQHGNMKLQEGSSARGGWAAYMCPSTDRAQRCQPVDAVTGRPWPKK
jgi:hypothetical protein